MTPKGADLAATDLIEVSTLEAGSYVTKSITGQELIDAIPLPPTGLTVGTTPIASGTVGRVLFEGTGNVLQQSGNLFWDNTNGRLGIGTSTPAQKIDVLGNINGGNLINIKNASTGVSAVSGFQCENSISNGSLFLTSNNYTPNGVLTANTLGFFSNANMPIAICSGNHIVMSTGGTTERMRVVSGTGNVLINTTTDAGFRLDVNGTARVQGDLTIARNINALTQINISNTTSGSNANPILNITSDVASGIFQFGKQSTLTNVYKTIAAKDGFIYNSTTGGDISLLNDFATGKIKFAAGGVSTPQMTLFSTGNLGINTTTDAGYKLDVNGTARVTGTGTGTTNSFVVQNNASVQTFSVNDLGQVQIGRTTAINWTFSSNTLTSSQYAYILSSNGSVLSTSAVGGVLGNDNGAKICDQGVGGSNQLPSAVLECNSTTRGFLPPRMTTTQRNAIASPAAGLIVYDTTLNLPHFFNGTIWVSL